MKLSHKAAGILSGVLLLLLLFSGAGAAADQIEVSPSVTLTFDNVPDAVLSGTDIKVDASAPLTDDMKALLKQTSSNIKNVAYVVKITPNGFERSDVSTAKITMPASADWAKAYKHLYIATIDGDTVKILGTTQTGTEKEPVYQTTTRGLPEFALLLATDGELVLTPIEDTEADPTETTSPAPLLGIIAGLAAVFCIRALRQ